MWSIVCVSVDICSFVCVISPCCQDVIYPKKSDFTVEEVAAVKSYFGPWPRALEACGILPDRSAEREAAKLQKRIAAKRRQTQYKLERQMPGNASGASLKYEGAQEITGWYL